jgi:hypothetical protein
MLDVACEYSTLDFIGNKLILDLPSNPADLSKKRKAED